MVMNCQVPLNARSFLTSWGCISFSRRPWLHGFNYLVCWWGYSCRKSWHKHIST